MIEFLERHGYTIESVPSWDWDHAQPNKHFDAEVKIAYLPSSRPDVELIKYAQVSTLRYSYGIPVTFRKELHKALLKL